jgi:hypothetical protein
MNIKDLKNLDKEDLLELLGVDTGISVLWTVGLVAIGAVAGATAALLLSPKSGRELLHTFGRRAKDTADDIITTARTKVNEAQAERG